MLSITTQLYKDGVARVPGDGDPLKKRDIGDCTLPRSNAVRRSLFIETHETQQEKKRVGGGGMAGSL